MPKQTVPVVVCEYHQEVLQYIHRFIASKKLPFTKLKMIHLDSHPDLGFPKNLVAQDCYNKEKMYNNLEIADWILPLMYSGHLEKLIWLKPPWAEQIPNCKSTFVVGEEKYSKNLRVTCNEDYFLEDGLYACSEQLDNSKSVVLQACKVSDLHYEILKNCEDTINLLHSESEFLNDGAKKFKLDNSLNHNNELIPVDGEKYILDIDLDYFSVTNPFLKDYTEEEYSKLKHIYNVSFPKDKSSTEDLATFVAKTQMKFQQLEDVIKKFATNSEIEETLENQEILTFLRQLKIRKSGENIDWDLVHVAGLTTELPHHISSEEKINNLVKEMVLLLKQLPPPSLITVARSAEDEYCPPDQVDMIERDVLQALQNVYNNMDITFDYKDSTRLC